jgi:hypothetical protein
MPDVTEIEEHSFLVHHDYNLEISLKRRQKIEPKAVRPAELLAAFSAAGSAGAEGWLGAL